MHSGRNVKLAAVFVGFLLTALSGCLTRVPTIDGDESCLFTYVEFIQNSGKGFPDCYLELKLDENVSGPSLKYRVATAYSMETIRSGSYESADIYVKFNSGYLDLPLERNHVRIEHGLLIEKKSITIFPRKIVVKYDFDVHTNSGTIKYYIDNFNSNEIKAVIAYLFNDPKIEQYDSVYFGDVKYVDVKRYVAKMTMGRGANGNFPLTE